MNELILNVRQEPGVIKINLTELREQLLQKLSEYKGAVFTEDTKDIAKKEVASLRALRKDIDDARKDVKKQWMQPYQEFEAEVKELLGLVDEPISLIDQQVKEFEEKRRAEKRKQIESIYYELAGEMAEYIPLSFIYDSRWENATKSIKQVREEIAQHIQNARVAVDGIKAMKSEKEPEALELYKRTQDMAKALKLISDYEQQKAAILLQEERQRRDEEIRRAREEERRKIEEAEKLKESVRAELEEENKDSTEDFMDSFTDMELPFEQPSTVTAFYKVIATPEELEQVEMAFNSIGIYFERRDG